MHVVLIILVIISGSKSAKILGFFPTPSISHQLTFQPIWRELANRGHELTIITPDPLHDKSIKNLKEIDLHDVSYNIWKKYNISTLGTTGDIDSSDMTPFIEAVFEIIDVQLGHPEVQKVIKNKNNDKYDLLLVEYNLPTSFPLKDIYNCPMIGIMSMPLMIHSHDSLGNPSHPVISPDLNLPFSRDLSFTERLKSFIYSISVRLLIRKYILPVHNLMRKHYGELRSDIVKYGRDVSLVFANLNPALHPPRPNVPALIDISGIHIKPEKPLPQELKEFMNNSKEGVIYVSFGSNIKSNLLPQAKINTLLETFADLPYNVLWKFESEDLQNKPKNVKIMNWIPQQDILRHPNTKLFIMQGGLQSWEESLYGKVPLIIIPFFGDQYGNARKVEEIGMGKSLKFSQLNKIDFKTTILEVITNEKYKTRLAELYSIAVDQPMTGLEKAIWWTEFVLRHNGAEHMRSPAVGMPYYQYFLIDVLLFLAVCLFACLFIIVKSVKFVIRSIRCMYKTLVNKKTKIN